MNARVLDAYINGRLAGRLVENGDVWGFAYEEDWISDPLAFALAPGIALDRRRHVDGSTDRRTAACNGFSTTCCPRKRCER